MKTGAARRGIRTGGWAWCLPVVALVVLAGCRTKDTSVAGDGALIQSSGDIKPTAMAYKEAQLVYGATVVPVELDLVRQKGDIVLRLLAHGEESDREIYRETQESFQLVGGAGETYDPPIDLLRFPMRIGSEWDWSGTMVFGGIPKKATARVTTSSERLFEDTAPTESLKTSVNLEIDANPPSGPKAKRVLSFWFVPNAGIVRREFGTAAIREPRKDQTEP